MPLLRVLVLCLAKHLGSARRNITANLVLQSNKVRRLLSKINYILFLRLAQTR